MNSLYLFISLRHPGRIKIGHSGNCDNRRKRLSADLSSVVIGGGIWLMFASKVEKALHRIYRPLQANMPEHAGYREWFWIVNPVTMFFCALALWVQGATGWEVYLPIIALFFPLPFDLAICYALYWLAQLFALHLFLPYLSGFTSLAWLWLKYQFINFINF